MGKRLSLFARAARMMGLQTQMIRQRDSLIAEYQRCILTHQRSMLDLAVGFRVALEMPEVDIRDDLDALIRQLEEGIAMYEEYVL